MISPAVQRYTGEIYRLQEDHSPVSLSVLAEHVDVSLQAVSRMIRRLKENGLIEHEPYQGVRLAPEGVRIALLSIRRHRILEVFLVKVMRFGWHETHDYADSLQSRMDLTLEDRMDELTGYPTRCPHGEPIPTKDAVMPTLDDMSLVTLPLGAAGKISRVRTHDPEKLQYFAELGLIPGVDIHLLTKAPFDGPLRLAIEAREQVLGYELAAALWVEPASQAER